LKLLRLATVLTIGLMAGGAGPAPGPLHIIGGPSTGGCIAGAISLPLDGPGFQTIHLNRSAFWGAPETIARLELFGRAAQAAGLPQLLIEDISPAAAAPCPVAISVTRSDSTPISAWTCARGHR